MSSLNAPRALLHIGAIKTGTTSIQAHLESVRHRLAERGFHYVGSLGSRDHHAFADALRQAAVSGAGAQDPALARLLALLKAEVANLPAVVRCVIISSEHLSGLPDAAVALARSVLDPLFGGFRIVAYLRRQDEFAVSRYTNMVRSGLSIASAMEVPPPNYAVMLNRWARVFGDAAIAPRIFAPEPMPPWDAIADFFASLGLADLAPAAPVRENPNLDPVAIGLIRRFTAMAAAQALDRATASRLRSRLAKLLQAEARGAGDLPSRAEAMAYVARCAAQNEAVRAKWFPGRTTLFHEDFSDYPEQAPAGPDDAQVLDLALRMLARLLV